MSIMDTLEDVKASLNAMMRKHSFKVANKARQEAADLQASLAKCRGKLEICRKDFDRAIKTQSANINEGMKSGMDTLIQEQMLWDSAIGYMLVKDAIFSLKSISSYDSIGHAYDLLEAATKQIAGKRGKLPKFTRIGSGKERDSYGYITSNASIKAKGEILDSCFEQLKQTGDIEQCLAMAKSPADFQASLRRAYTGVDAPRNPSDSTMSDLDSYMARINSASGDGDGGELPEDDLESMQDIHPPKE